MTSYPAIWNDLAAEFEDSLVCHRPIKGGTVAYITARTAMNRLDKVMGFENWWDEYERDAFGGDNVVCKLTIRLPDGQLVTKCDAGAPGNTGDEGDDDKGAFSDAFKRAAVKFGIGRHLYRDGVWLAPRPGSTAVGPPPVVEPASPAAGRAMPSPSTPSHSPSPQARASRSSRESRPSQANPPYHNGGERPDDRLPISGGQLFRWLKSLDEQHDVGIFKYVNSWAKLQEFPEMMRSWDVDQVNRAVAEARRKLDSLLQPAGRGDAFEETTA